MVASLDWKQLTLNPVDLDTSERILRHLKSIRRLVSEDSLNFLNDSMKDKDVLDIGICEHDLSHMRHPSWRHASFRRSARRLVGIDIIEDLISLLKSEGYNAMLCDATSDTDLGERFDFIHLGDIIEHVDNPVALLRFAERHLRPDGKIIVSTPNPFYLGFVLRNWWRGTFIANFEHVSWITPSMALELGRRANLCLTGYDMFIGRSRNALRRTLKRWFYSVVGPEAALEKFFYTFSRHSLCVKSGEPDSSSR